MTTPKTDNELLSELVELQRATLEQQIIIVNSLDWIFASMFAVIGLLIVHLFFLAKGAD